MLLFKFGEIDLVVVVGLLIEWVVVVGCLCVVDMVVFVDIDGVLIVWLWVYLLLGGMGFMVVGVELLCIGVLLYIV